MMLIDWSVTLVSYQVTAENPHILIPKTKIMEDFKMRAAVCDFHPVKKQVGELE